MELLYKKILLYLTIVCLLTPFFVDTRTYFPFIVGKATIFRIIVSVMLALFAWRLIDNLPFRRNFFDLTPLAKIIIIFGIAIFVSAVFGVDFIHSFFSNNERMEGVLGVWYFILFFLIIASSFKPREMEKIFKIEVVISLFYSFWALLTYPNIGKITAHISSIRLSGYTGNPSFFAVYLLFNAFLALYFYFRQFFLDKKLFNWWILAFLSQSFLMFFTLTRGAMLGYLFGIIFLSLGIVFFQPPKANIFKPFKAIALVFLIGILVLSFFIFSAKNTSFVKNNPILSRFASISLSDPTAISRILSTKIAWQSFLQKPLFGWGQENYEAAYVKNFDPEVLKYLPGDFYFDRAHNKLMEVLATNGIFSFLSYLGIFGIAAYFLNRLRKNEEWFLPALALGGCLIGYFIQNIFIFDFHESYLMFFLILAFTASLYHHFQDFQEKENVIPAKAGMRDSHLHGNDKMKENDNAKDFSLKMGRGLLIVAVVCLVIFSASQWVIKPYSVSRGIFNINRAIKQGQGEKASQELARIITQPHFFKDDIIISVRKIYSLYSFKIDEASRAKIIEALLLGANQAAQNRPWRFSLINSKADLETIGSQWDKNLLVEAEKSTAMILANFPHFPSAHLLAAKFFFLKGEMDKAITEAQSVIAVDPDLATAYYILAYAHDSLGDAAQRDENLIKAAELNFPFKDKNQITNVINLCLLEEKYQTIINLYLQGIQIDPQEVSFYTGLAATYGKLQNKIKAIEYAQKAVQLNPSLKQAAEEFIQLIRSEEWDKIPY